jgi:HD-GYP domain-containing protein (c-di-GMP phosphodiesterase class II)
VPDNGQSETNRAQSLHFRSRTAERRHSSGRSVPRIGKYLWIVGVVTILASTTTLLMGQEPTLFNYAATFALLGSLGMLALVSAGRALDFSVRYEESMLYVKEVERSYESLRQVVSSTIDVFDHRPDGSERVVRLSLDLGSGLGLPAERLHHLEWAAFLHDIGKVRLDGDLITKPGPLSAGEWGEMQQHPYFSYSILTQVDHLRDAAEIVYCHHERFDGQGYPRRLRGTEIPVEARIFAVADAYDAMLSERPYRAAGSHDEAVREIIAQADRQFDPAVVAVFVQWATSVGGESTRRTVEEGLAALPAGLAALDRPHWAYPK